MLTLLTSWNPEDQKFWNSVGRKIARRNLWLGVVALALAFVVWTFFSVVAVNLPKVGFNFTKGELFSLAALPGLSGSTLRIFYTFFLPVVGGRRFTVLSTASLLIPTLWLGYAVQDPATSYSVFAIIAVLCGFGGGNFASSMTNISFFFPKKEKGNALALNAGLGNLGVSIGQFVGPLVIACNVFDKTPLVEAVPIFLENIAFFWVIPIALITILAWFFMNDIAEAKSPIKTQMDILKSKHTWFLCCLYVGTFGSYIGFSAGFALLSQLQFPDIELLKLVFIGPLLGALSRAASGWVCDKYGGAKITQGVFVAMIIMTFVAFFFISTQNFAGFFISFLVLFLLTGVGNASVFKMIPTAFWQSGAEKFKGQGEDAIRRVAERQSAAAVGFVSAIGSYGAYIVPKSYGSFLEATGSAANALFVFAAYYTFCFLITWLFYTRTKAVGAK